MASAGNSLPPHAFLYLGAVARSLGRRRAGNLAALYGQLFFQQPEFHLLTRRLEDVAEEEAGATA